jgi:uncharacterized protein
VTFAPRCPLCRQLVEWTENPFRPFCSERCQLLDLGAWASERYRIAGDPAEPERDDGDDPSEDA